MVGIIVAVNNFNFSLPRFHQQSVKVALGPSWFVLLERILYLMLLLSRPEANSRFL